MGKKNKKSFYKKQLKPFVKGNRVLLAALGGAAAGITLANIMGREKAQEILHTVEDSIAHITDKVTRGLGGNPSGNVREPERNRKAVEAS
jgi:hypothetical protein